MIDLAKRNKLAAWIIGAILLFIVPFAVQMAGNAWVRIIDIALLYVLLALGLNIVVGYAGLLDLGYVAFYAVGAYMLGLLASPQLTDTFPAIAAAFPNGLHMPWWVVIPLGAAVAGIAGVLLGAAPTPSSCAATTWRSSPSASARSCACSSTTSTRRSTSPTARRASRNDEISIFGASAWARPAPLVRPRVAEGHQLLFPVPGPGGARGDHLPSARAQP